MPYDICEDEMTLDYIESQMADKGGFSTSIERFPKSAETETDTETDTSTLCVFT